MDEILGVQPFIGPNHIKYLNVTAHPLNLYDPECGEFVVPPSGYIVDVEIEIVETHDHYGIRVDVTRLIRNPQTETCLRALAARGIVVIGSSTAAYAYPHLVYAPVMVRGRHRTNKAAHARRFSVPYFPPRGDPEAGVCTPLGAENALDCSAAEKTQER